MDCLHTSWPSEHSEHSFISQSVTYFKKEDFLVILMQKSYAFIKFRFQNDSAEIHFFLI